MAYTKTIWVNGTTPALNDTNLNKIEQGIADALPKDGSDAMTGQLKTISGSAATPAIAPTGDSNTGIYFPAADTIAFGEGGTEVMRITSAGNVLIGTTSALTSGSAVTGRFQLAGTTLADASANFQNFTADFVGPTFYFGKSRSTTIGSYANAVVLDDVLMHLIADGSDGAGSLRRGGSISINAEGTFSATSSPSYIRFLTTNSGSVSATEKMRITSAGYALIGYTTSNGAYPLQVNGQIFATSSTIATSDARYKTDVTSLDGALDIVKALNPVQFSWKDHPIHKFNTNVPTVGFLAQEVEKVLADKPYLDSIIKKNECTWEEETGEFTTETVEKEIDGEVVTEEIKKPVTVTKTEEFLGIAEGNLIAILTKAVKELTAKVEALEAKLNP